MLDPGTTKNDEGRVFYLPPEALAAMRAWNEQTEALERERGIVSAAGEAAEPE